jgi:ATP-dependent Clp protease ATP-binding subunit ClpA
MSFFWWYYTGALRGFLVVWKHYVEHAFDFFSTADLAMSLFSPWHRDISYKHWRGFNPILSLRRFAENIFSRLLGGIVRVCVILISFAWVVIIGVVGLLLLVMWILAPIFLALSPIAFAIPSAVVLPIASIAVLIFSLWCFRESQKTAPAKRKLEDLWNEPFFERILARVDVDKSSISRDDISSPQRLEALFTERNIRQENFVEAVQWEISLAEEAFRKSQFWNRDRLLRSRSIGRDWKYGYTPRLDEVSEDMFASLSREFQSMRVCAHPKSLELLVMTLSRNDQNNAILVGVPGSGRKTLLAWFAKMVYERTVEGPFRDVRILRLDIERVIAQNGGDPKRSTTALEELFFGAAYAGNVILVVDDLEYYVGEAAMKNGNPDITPILERYLPLPSFRLIATMSSEGFHTYADRGKGLLKHMERIEIEELNDETTLRVLLDEFSELESDHVVFTIKALRHIIRRAQQFQASVPNPERSLDMAKEVLIYQKSHFDKERIDSKMVDAYITLKTGVSAGALSEKQQQTLLQLEDVMGGRIIGQRGAINSLAKALRKARSEISGSMRPTGSFLFLGPTGVGKTETAKVLTKTYFGGNAAMIRLDMSEFQLPGSVEQLIGSRESGLTGRLVQLVRDTPYGVLLLDELEKAHPGVRDLFLQVLDEGFLTDAFGEKVRFNNLIIIATSNAGAPAIFEYFEANPDGDLRVIEKQVVDTLIATGLFRAEFLNRFDGVIFFSPLSRQEILRVIEILLAEFVQEVWKNRRIRVSFEGDVIETIERLGYDPSFGARSVRRFIADTVEAIVAERIIAQNTPENGEIVVSSIDVESISQKNKSI